MRDISKTAIYLGLYAGVERAGDGDRTRMTSLEGWGSTIELHPRGSLFGERKQ